MNDLGVRWYRSLSFKMFLFVILQVLPAAMLVGWHNATSFKAHLDRQAEGDLVVMAEKGASAILGVVEGWRVLAHLVGHAAINSKTPEFSGFLKSMIESNRELLSAEIILDYNGSRVVSSSRVVDPRFARQGAQNVADLKLLQATPHTLPFLTPITFAADETLVRVAVPLQVKDKSLRIWSILYLTTDRIRHLLIQSTGIMSFLGNSSGQNFLPALQKSATIDIPPTQLVVFAKESQYVRFRFVGEGSNGKMVSVVPVPETDLFVYIIKNIGSEWDLAPELQKMMLFVLMLILVILATTTVTMSALSTHIKAITFTTAKIAAGDFDVRLPNSSRDEIGILVTAVNKMATDMKKYVEIQKIAVRQDAELRTAQAVESTLFPPGDLDDNERIRCYALRRSASECAGDWWWSFPVGPDQTAVLVADATGHGAPAALVVAMAHAFFTTCHELKLEISSPAQVLTLLNRTLHHAGHGRTTLTMFICLFNLRTGRLTYANAAHNQPILVAGNENDMRIRKGKSFKYAFSLAARGNVVGMLRDASYEDKTVSVCPGDKIILFTDGLVECRNARNQSIRSRDLMTFADKCAPINGRETREAFRCAVNQHFGDHGLDDDITVVVIEIPRVYEV